MGKHNGSGDELQALKRAKNQRVPKTIPQQEYAQQLEALHQISLEIVAENDPTIVIERALSLASKLLKANPSGYWRLKQNEQEQPFLELILSTMENSAGLGRTMQLSEIGFVTKTAQTGQTEWTEDYQNASLRHAQLGRDTWRSLITVPLKHKNQLDGVFIFVSQDPEILYNQHHAQILERFAALCSVALENAYLFKQTSEIEAQSRQRAQLLEVMHEFSLELKSNLSQKELFERILERAVQLIQVEASAIYLLENQALQLGANLGIQVPDTLAFGQGVIGTVAQDNKPLLVNDYQHSPYRLPGASFTVWSTIMATPLQQGNRLIGVLAVAARDVGRQLTDTDLETLERFAALASVALENTRMYEALQQTERATQRQNTLLTSLHDANLELSAALEPKALLESLLERAMQLLDGDAGRLFLVQPDKTLKLEATRGSYADIQHMLFGQGLSGLIAERNESMIIEDYEAWHGRVSNSDSDQWHSTIGVPLRRGGQVIGTLVVADIYVSGRFTKTDLEVLERFAALATVALENARLFESAKTAQIEAQHSRLEAHRRALQLEAVYQTSLELGSQLELDIVINVLVERVATLFLADTGAVYFRVPNTDIIKLKANFGTSPRLSGTIHHGLSGYVVRSGKPKVVNDYRDWDGRDPKILTQFEWRSAMSAPITQGSQVIGVLSIADTRYANRFGSKELEVLERFAAFASVALENARLHEIERQSLKEERLRSQIAVRLSPLRAVPELCDAILEELYNALGYERISLFLLKDQTLTLQTKRGFASAVQSFSVKEGIIGRAVRTRQAQMILDPLSDRDYTNPKPNPGAFICLPIHSGNRDLGAINFGLPQGQIPNQTDLAMLESLMPTISAALENAFLHSELETRAEELEILRQKAEQAASHDPLTGLGNRRALEQILGAARVEDSVFTLAALDLTGFKSVNDKLGHDAGDNALKRIANVLNTILENLKTQPGMKGAFRVGGDEFFMLIPQPYDASLEICQVILARITELEFPKKLRVSTNIGLAEFPTEAKTIDELLSLADTRMYAAKRVGLPYLSNTTESVQSAQFKRRQTDA